MNHDGIIAREGFPFILPLVIFAVSATVLGAMWSAIGLSCIAVFVIWFFRNPDRKTPDIPQMVVSPADGKVIRIEEDIERNDLIKGRFKKISIFMNVFNVHVNRIPYSGRIQAIAYHQGMFFSANLDKASDSNERNSIVIRTDDGREIMAVQIAGLIARRIVCWIKEGMDVRKGERFGLIRFGSRLDVYLPLDSTITVKIGDRVRAGETPLGGLS
jgi:phosphatidylserine decarboxylase